MHVTGIAAGNGIEAAATGERFLGIAPEAQVMFMRVLQMMSWERGLSLH